MHGRGAKHQHSNRMNNVILRIGLRKNTQDRKDCDFDTFPPGKITKPLFALFFQKCHFFSSKKGSPNRPMLVVKHINSDPVFRSLKIKGSNYRRTAAVRHPPDAARKNQLLNRRRRRRKTKDGHQFFITAGWIERFAQKTV